MSALFNKMISGRQFNFQSLDFGAETGYHVDVKDEDGTRWEFRMFHARTDQSKIEGENPPSWITELEAELSNAINNYE